MSGNANDSLIFDEVAELEINFEQNLIKVLQLCDNRINFQHRIHLLTSTNWWIYFLSTESSIPTKNEIQTLNAEIFKLKPFQYDLFQNILYENMLRITLNQQPDINTCTLINYLNYVTE